MSTDIPMRLKRSLTNTPTWAADNFPSKEHLIADYIEGSGSLYRACRELFSTGMINIGNGLLLAANGSSLAAQKSLAWAVREMLVADTILIQRLRETQDEDIAVLDDITLLMLCALATGQFELIAPIRKVIFTALENGYGVRDGHNLPLGTTLRYAAFGLTIIGDWLGKPLDLDKHALPRDPAWGQLVAHWREPNPEKLLPVLLTACDTHVERIALTSRELDSGNFEFGSPFEAVYPAEILAILNLRRSLGLTNPLIDHPLMKTPYAALTCPPGTRFEKDELLERFLLAARKYDPEDVPDGFYEAVLQS
ncbi:MULTISPECIES: hypothetical protein [Pseudomonas]|uniref:hypothetical protein n=1 Tax=Pseudomonas TaxID=286 RepID=UPI001CE413C7|nr:MULTISPECIES: hypothetical protein [Pseudomonas]MCO7594766.1 hypothetical protein [Pseudomonas guariconensis]MCO7634871.1 hypothetical protein [Pseudomonas guariconensis]MCU7221447.1 hypothetical protein [Pseudomonas brassicacearum]